MAFERGVPIEPDRGPVPGLLIGRSGDPAAILPEVARSRWQALQQRHEDARALSTPLAEAINELRVDLQREQARLRQLTLPRSAGGFGLRTSTEKEPTDDIQVRDVERKIAALGAELRRKQVLLEDRAARTNTIGRLVERIEAWLNGGIPGGNRIVDHGEIDVAALKQRGETSEAATLERLQRRLRELAADRHRVQSAPLPSADAIAKARAEIEALAQRGEPDVSAIIEVGAPIRWPHTAQRLDLVGFAINKAGEAQLGGMAQGEVADPMALMAWLHKDALVARIETLIREQSDEKVALSEAARAEKLAQIDNDRLEVERAECALIWKLHRDGQAVEFREDADIRAVLGVSLEVDDRPQRPFGQAAHYSHVIEVTG